MSQAQFQEALAMLIRLPEHNRLNLEEFLNRYELSNADKDNLRYVAKQREVFKFGYKMRQGRINFIIESIPLSLEYIDRERMMEFIQKEFDPEYTLIHAREIYREFRDYFVRLRAPHCELAQRYFDKLPDFFWDLVNFELLEAELEFQGFQDLPVPQEGLLKHTKFEVLSFDFKIHSFIEKKRRISTKKRSSVVPLKERTHLLFLKDDEIECGYQIFEIDEIGSDFLLGCRRGEILNKPMYYEDFVECGLCK